MKEENSPQPFSIDLFKTAVGCYASGIVVITTLDDDGPVGFTCQSFHSLSMTPPLINFGVMKTSTSYPRIRQQGRFGVNILTEKQRNISSLFAKKNLDKWEHVFWKLSNNGNPVLADALAFIDCKLYQEESIGDHYLVVGQTLSVVCQQDVSEDPLIYFRGDYRNLHSITPAP